jgi:hypothetical protein
MNVAGSMTLTGLLNPLLTAVKEADESVTSSTTIQDDDDLQLTLAANSYYKLEAHVIVFSASATPDFRFQYVAADGTWDGLQEFITETLDLKESTPELNINLTSAGATQVIRLTASVQTGGSGGLFKLRWAQTTSNATATTVKAGSFMRAEKLA